MKGLWKRNSDSSFAGWFLIGVMVASLGAMLGNAHARYRIDEQIAGRQNERVQSLALLEAGAGRTRLQAFESELQGCIAPKDVHFSKAMWWMWFTTEEATDAVVSLEQRCAESIIWRVFLVNPQEAVALAGRAQSNGYYLEDDVLDRVEGGL